MMFQRQFLLFLVLILFFLGLLGIHNQIIIRSLENELLQTEEKPNESIETRVDSPKASDRAAMTGLLLKLLGGIILIVVVYTFVRSIKTRRLEESFPRDGAGTMVETFQRLVRELKEKETELQGLKLRAEQRAADIENYNENILQSVASGVITFDRSRTITTFNPAAERVLGIRRDEVMGKTSESVFGKQSAIVRTLQEVFKRETVLSRQEFELQRPIAKDRPVAFSESSSEGGGSSRAPRVPERIWVGISTSLLRDGQGQIIGATFVFTDLTEIKRLQEQVELKRRLTVLGEMSAGIAHEFRNFMGTIMGFAKLISKRSAADDPRKAMVDAITREINAMNQLIEELLSFGRHAELSLSPVDLEALFQKIVPQLRSQGNGLVFPDLRIEIPSGVPLIRLDEILIRQAFTNLLQNSVEAMPEGGELRINVNLVEQDRTQRSGAGEVLIEVLDTGVGIPKDKQEKIFLPFFTLKEKGTGMGLALVHKIILSHNGRITVESAEGEGTTFRIHLPLKEG